MACEAWRGKLDAYLDGELEPAQATALSTHLRSCGACAADTLERVRMKRSLAAAGRRYEPSPKLRAQVALSVANPRRKIGWQWMIVAVPAALVLIASVAVNLNVRRENARRQRVYSELADLHVAALASSTPVDVLSTDRHTVKPWFQGKIPFTFNLPDLQGSEFTLLGGRVAYFAQMPGAHLIYQLRKHEISVFIFQDRGAEAASLPLGVAHALSFSVESWKQDGLRYFVVGDAGAGDIETLSKLLRSSG
jgi:anti-sigma factor RsiW